MTLRILASIRHISINFDYDKPFEFKGVKLREGGPTLDPKLFNEFFVKQVGFVFAREFINYPYFFQVSRLSGNPDIQEITLKVKSHLNAFATCLWLAKDNAVSIGVVYGLLAEHNRVQVSQNLFANSNSKGYFDETAFSKNDFVIASRFYKKIQSFLPSGGVTRPDKEGVYKKPVIVDSDYHFKNYDKISRVERCISFLNMARTNSFPQLKIALYVAALECLFTQHDGEISHKVSTRCAKYLGGNLEAKDIHFKRLKNAYSVRSTFIHGQLLQKGKKDRLILESISVDVDRILRFTLRKVLVKDMKIFQNEASLETFLKKLDLN